MAIRNFLSDTSPAVQVVDPIAQFAKAQGARNLIQQGQQNEQELAINDQRLAQNTTAAEKAKRIEGDTRTFGEVYLAAKGNPDETVRLAAERGIHPDLIQNFQQHNAKLAETAARTDAALLPVKEAKLKQAQGLLMDVEKMPPEALVHAWPLLYKKALALDPEAKDYLSPMQPPNAQQFAALNAAVANQDYHLKKEAEKRLTATATQQATAAADVHTQKGAELPGIVSKTQTGMALDRATLANPELLNPGQASQAKGRVMTLGEQRRHNQAMESRPVGGASALPASQELIDSIAKDPARYFDLTSTDRRKVLPALSRLGVDLGKPLSEKAIGTLSDLESGIQSLDSTVAAIRQGEQNMGPFAGWATSKNPWASDAGKRLQSQIDLTRQIIGKALEGGVLRKEDEIKYKAILADITNTPSSAVAKLENVRTELESKLGTWEKNQRGAGRSVPPRESASGGGGQQSGRKVGDVVNIGGKRVKIKALHGDGSFDGDEVQ